MSNKLNFKRSFLNLGMLMAVVIQLAYIGYTLYINSLFYEPEKINILYAYTILFGLSGFIYFAPIYPALPFAFSYLDERNSGYIYYMIERMEKKKYIFQKILWTGLSGGLASAFPVFICFVYFTVAMHPSVADPTSQYYPYMFSDMNYAPYVGVWGGCFLLLVELILIFMFGVFWSEMTLLVSLITKNKYITFVLPTALYLLSWLLSPKPSLYCFRWLDLYRGDFNLGYPLFFAHIIQLINIIIINVLLIIIFKKQVGEEIK